MIGQALAFPNDVYEVDQIARPMDLYDSENATLWRTILAMAAKGRPISVATLVDEIVDRDGEASREGLSRHLAEFVTIACGSGAIVDAARAIARMARARRVTQAALTIVARSSDPRINDDDLVDGAQATITMAAERRADDVDVTLPEAIDEVVAGLERAGVGQTEPVGLSSGLEALDAAIGGMQPGQVIIIAAKTGCGKTACAASIANHTGLVAGKEHTLFVSLEMRQRAIATRALAGMTGISQARIRRGTQTPLVDHEIERARTVSKAPEKRTRVVLRCDPYATVASIRSHARRTQVRHGLNLIVVDYLQLVSAESEHRGGTREREVAEVSRGLKRMALDLGVPVIALCQLSREAKDRDVPILSDLRESGAIEQDADIIAFIAPTKLAMCVNCDKYRDETDEKCTGCGATQITGAPEEVSRDAVRLVLAKNREDPQTTVFLRFTRSLTQFGNLPGAGPTPPSTQQELGNTYDF